MSFLPYVCLLAVVFATVSSSDDNLNKLLFNGDYELIDLTYTYDNNTVYWPDMERFVFTKKQEQFNRIDNSWYAAYDFLTGEHVGTHIDAPFHFILDGKHVSQIPPERLIVPIFFIDVSNKVNGDPDFVLHNHHLDYILKDNSGQPCLIVFKFGWTKYYNTDKFVGKDKLTNTLNFPGLGADIAERIVSRHKNVVGVGVDVASADPGSSVETPAHKILLGADLYIIENIKLDRDLPDSGCTALALPMKIADGTGAPLRLIAICPKRNHWLPFGKNFFFNTRRC